MAVEKSLRCLYRIGLDEAGVRMRQVEAEHMQLHPHAADDGDAFAEIDLRMTGRMRERHEDLSRPRARQPHIVLHHRTAGGEGVFVPKPFENLLRCMPLLGGCRLIGLDDRVALARRAGHSLSGGFPKVANLEGREFSETAPRSIKQRSATHAATGGQWFHILTAIRRDEVDIMARRADIERYGKARLRSPDTQFSS
jgi:hypothetical protein